MYFVHTLKVDERREVCFLLFRMIGRESERTE